MADDDTPTTGLVAERESGDLLVVHDGFTAPLKRLPCLHHVLQHCDLGGPLVVVDPIFEGVIAATDSQCQVSLFQLDAHSHQSEQVEVVLDVCKRDGNADFPDLGFNGSLDFSVGTFPFSSENDGWVVEKLITELVDLLGAQGTVLGITVSEMLEVTDSRLFVLKRLNISSSLFFIAIKLSELLMKCPVSLIMDLDLLEPLSFQPLHGNSSHLLGLRVSESLQFGPLDLNATQDIVLNVDVLVYGLLDNSQVWHALRVVPLHEASDVMMVLPLLLVIVGSHIQAQVDDGSCWSSGHAGGAVEVDLHPLLVDQVVQALSGFHDSMLEAFLGGIVNWDVVESVDTSVSVSSIKELCVGLSLGDFPRCLEVDDSFGTSTCDLVNVNLVEWIWTNNYVSLINIRYEESTHETSVLDIDDTINEKVSV